MKFQVAWDPEEKDNGKLVLGGCSGGDCVTMQPQDPRQR